MLAVLSHRITRTRPKWSDSRPPATLPAALTRKLNPVRAEPIAAAAAAPCRCVAAAVRKAGSQAHRASSSQLWKE